MTPSSADRYDSRMLSRLTSHPMLLILLLLVSALVGCARPAVNPSFPVSLDDARDLLREMDEHAKPLERPVVVLGGIHDPGFAAPSFRRRLLRATDENAQVIAVSFLTAFDFESCRRRLIDAVNRRWPSEDPQQTVEVDVVAISMGGLVARYAARDRSDDEPRLNVRRLFTISTPHRGASLAELPTLDRRVLDMRTGSAFLDLLNRLTMTDEPELVAYVRLDDGIVGEANAAPPRGELWWVPNAPFSLSHMAAASDPRILADIARRLRGEPPLTRSPAAVLPQVDATGPSS
jgi:pimeloyl-ACP methyl ester carboxylesterase